MNQSEEEIAGEGTGPSKGEVISRLWDGRANNCLNSGLWLPLVRREKVNLMTASDWGMGRRRVFVIYLDWQAKRCARLLSRNSKSSEAVTTYKISTRALRTLIRLLHYLSSLIAGNYHCLITLMFVRRYDQKSLSVSDVCMRLIDYIKLRTLSDQTVAFASIIGVTNA